MPCLVAVDGGGTKTDVLMADASGRVLSRIRVGSTSLRRRDAGAVERELAAALATGLRRIRRSAADCAACCGGFAGAGREPARRALRGILRRLLPHARVRVLTDFEIAFAGALGVRDGIVLIAGTGSVAYGRRGKRSLRVGGLGPGLGDAGSADWIGRQAAAAGLGPPSPVPGEYAAWLPSVVEAACAGDRAARGLLDRAGAELAELVLAAACRLRLTAPEIAVVGGLVRHAPPVRAKLRAALRFALPKARLRFPARAPVHGALALAVALYRDARGARA